MLGGKQARQPAPARADDPGILAAPEVAVMHEQRLGAFGGRLLDDRKARGDGEDRPRDDRRAFHLQTVWTIILDCRSIQKLIQVTDQVRRTDHLVIPAPAIRSLSELKKYWLLFAQGVTVMLAALFVLATLQAGVAAAPVAPAGRSAPSGPAQSGTGAASGSDAAPGRPLHQDAERRRPHRAARAAAAILSYSEAARRATPAVVNILTGDQVSGGRRGSASFGIPSRAASATARRARTSTPTSGPA